MAVNQVVIAAPPERVYELLSDAPRYAEWVVGAKAIRAADETFPAPGSRFQHTVGVGPLEIRDATTVLEAEAPRNLVLRAGLGRLGAARVTLVLQPAGDGTRVVMQERGERGPLRLAERLGSLAFRGRNFLSLDRLKRMAERDA